MKKHMKGFTLIELLAVIVVLGLLIAIISPIVSNLLKDSKDNLSEQQKDMIITASKKYMIDHSELLPEDNDRAIVYMDDLVNSGVIDNDKIVDPKTKEEINGCVVVSYNNEYNQYDYNYSSNDNDCLITVTFDPEGGSVGTTSKQVKLNSTYGELPTPTREGYTFKGWRGKNILNFQEWLSLCGWANRGTIVKKENGILISATGNDAYTVTYGQDGSYKIPVKPNTTYTLSWETNNNLSGRVFVFINNKQDSGYVVNANQDAKKCTFTTTSDAEYITYRVGVTNEGNSIEYYNIQIEKGNTATEYEPFKQYSSNTVVTKSSDHTLHAIWEIAS